MGREVVLTKLASLKRCVSRVEAQGPLDAARLTTDLDRQDVVVLNLMRAVMVCVDAAMHLLKDLDERPPASMAEAFEALWRQGVLSEATAQRMQKAVGFRNMAVHEYDTLNMDIVAAIATTHLNDFRAFAAEVLEWLDQQDQ